METTFEHEIRPRAAFKWLWWVVLATVLLGLVVAAFILFSPKNLTVTGTLKTKDGPLEAGLYDFRLKFYDATTRTDLVYSHDAESVPVDTSGNFNVDIPAGHPLNVPTLMQVCLSSEGSTTPGTVSGGGNVTLPSCEIDEPSSVAFNQTICGLTAVEQNPTNLVNWLETKNIVYATPTKACGQSPEAVGTVSDDDVVESILHSPGSLTGLLGGVDLQPGSLLTIGSDGQVAAMPPQQAVGEAIRQEIENSENNGPSPTQTVINETTNVFNSYPTNGEPNTDSQTLSLSGNILSISGGNSVTLPSGGGSDPDEVIGNEILDVSGSGLVRVGAGTTLDPFRVGLITCASGQLLKSTGPGAWNCASDADTTYAAGTGISFSGTTINNTGVLSFAAPASGGLANTGSGQNISLKLKDCANGEILQFNGGVWDCVVPGSASPYSFSITDTTTTESVLNGDTVTFIGNEGLIATVTAGDDVTYGIVDGGVTTIKLDDGAVIESKIADGAVTTIKLDSGAVTNDKLANSSLTVSAGSGLSGGGVVSLGSSTTLNLQPCTNGQILKHNGTTWACAPDNDTGNQTLSIVANAPNGANTVSYDLSISGGNTVNFDDRDTLYSSVTGGGLALNGTAFSLQTCPVGQILKSTNAGSPAYACAADTDTNTTYSAGTGLSLVGTTFNNTGVLGVTASGALTSSGGQNPNVAFADGSATGQFWQWDGDSWELASLPAEGDAIVGNEVVGVTGAASGLTRSGSGTSVSPYTLAANVGNGIQITANAIAINSPTCSGTDKLQWTGSAFTCAADTDTNTTYSAGTGLSLVGTTFSNTGTLSVTASGALTSSGGQTPNIAFANGSITGQFWQWDGDSWELATLAAEGDAVVGNEVTNVTGVNSGLVRSGSGTAVSPYTLAVSVGNGLQLTGGNVAINSPTCAGTTKLQWTGTAFVCSADVDTDTTNFSITDGTTSQSVSAAQAITFVGNSTTKTTVTLGGTRQLTFGLDITGAINGQVLTYNGSALAWQTPTTYAPTSCAVGGTYFCQGGNTFGTTAVLGTNDAQSLTFETNNTVQMTVLANGNVGIGTSPTEKLDVNGNINIPATSSTVGVIKQGGIRLIHTKDDGSNSSLFAGLNSGNLTTTGFDNVGVGSNALAALTDGFYNTAVGSGALAVTTDGIYNTALGFSVLGLNVGGYYNTGAGSRALFSNTEGFNNAALGADALFSNLTGSSNTALGVGSLGANETGTGNTGVGEYSGDGNVIDNELVSGNNNTFLGTDSSFSSSTQLDNATAVGAFSVVGQSNSLVLGCISGVNDCPARTRVGIGVASPQNMLQIDGGAGAVTTMAQFTNTVTGQTSADGFNLGIDQNGTAFLQQREAAAPIVFYTGGNLRLVLDSTGRFGISQNAPGYLLHVGSSSTTAGTAVARFESASGTCTVTPVTGMACTSDERAKKNISDYGGALDIVNQIEVKEYNMKTDPGGATKQIGVIAQQVEGLLPSLVTTDSDGRKSFSYAGLTPVLLQAIKEQQVQIDAIQKGVWDGGVVTKDTTFKTAATFEGPVRFSQQTTFEDNVEILGKIRLSGDQVNSAVVQKGERRINVSFKGSYPNQPYITASPREFIDGEYRITEVKKTGFVIELSRSQSKTIRFDWHAFSR